jgi:hypothetical protein
VQQNVDTIRQLLIPKEAQTPAIESILKGAASVRIWQPSLKVCTVMTGDESFRLVH